MREKIERVLEENFSFWEKLNTAEKQKLVLGAAVKRYLKGSLVHSANEKCLGIILVLNGQLRVYMESEEGRDITLYRLEAGELCTLTASCFMNEITFEVLVDTEKDSEVILISPSVFNQVAMDNVYVENFLYKETASRFSDVMWAMQQILFLSFDRRLALFLLEEQKKTGSSVLSMTHEQIAKYIGSAREVVSRMLKYFEEEGLVALSRGKIRILDTRELEMLADG